MQQPRRLDAAAGTIRAAASAAARAVADARSESFAVALARAHAAAAAGAVAFGSFNCMLDLADAILIVGCDRLHGRDDLLHRLGFRRRSLPGDHNRLRLFDGRHRELRPRLVASAQDLRRGLRLAQAAAATAAARPGTHQEHEMRFLVHRLFERRGLGAIHDAHRSLQRV